MKKVQLGIMTLASLAGIGVAISGFTPKHRFTTITVYAVKSGSTYSYYTLANLPGDVTCVSTTTTERCTITTTLTISRLNDTSGSPNYTTSFPAASGSNPKVTYIGSTTKVYK